MLKEQKYNCVKEYFSSTECKQYSMKVPIFTKEGKQVSIKQLPQGITILEEVHPLSTYELDNPIISYFTKRIDVTDPTPVRIPTLNFNSKKRRHYFRNSESLWKSIFPAGEDVIYTNKNLSLRMNISKSIETFSNFSSREEIYFPLAFLEKDIPIGGSYIYLWNCGKNQLSSTRYLPISIFHSISCMFGNTLYGIDERLQKHPLADPKYKIPTGSVISNIEDNIKLHPEELFFKKSFINLIPLMKTLSKNVRPIIKHQIPLENYILYGINKYLGCEITRGAFENYVKKVKLRAKEHEVNLKNLAAEHNFDIEFYSSLRSLNLDTSSEKTIIEDLFDKINLKNQLSKIGNCKSVIQPLFFGIVNYLSSLSNSVGETWKIIKNRIQENSNLIDTHNLLQINYLDYSATLALIKRDEIDQEICSIMPTHEKHIALGYKDLFSEKFGNVLCMNYLPSLHICIEKYNNSIFHLRNHIHEVNGLLNAGITSLSALQTASVALDSAELSRYATQRIWHLISTYCETSKQGEPIFS